MLWILFFLLGPVAADILHWPGSDHPGIGIALDRTHGTASIASYDGSICNIAMIPGNAAYLEYMRNATTGPISSTGEAIAFPTYKTALKIEDMPIMPIQRMLLDLFEAVKASHLYDWWHDNTVRVSLPLVFADAEYAERVGFEMLNAVLSWRRFKIDKYEIGSSVVASSGDICLSPVHPLMPNITRLQPLSRFRRSAVQALAQLNDRGDSFIRFKVRFSCAPLPYRGDGAWPHEIHYLDRPKSQSTGQLTIDGRLD